MTKSKSKYFAKNIANTFGSFGYISLLTSWTWVIVTIILPYLRGSALEQLFFPQSTDQTISAQTLSLPPIVSFFIMAAALVFAVGLSIYAIYALPKNVAKVGKKLTNKSAAVTVKHVKYNHKPLSKKQTKRFIEYFSWSLKLVLIIVPCLLSLIPAKQNSTISQDIIIITSCFLSLLTAVWFSFQYLVAKFNKVDFKYVW